MLNDPSAHRLVAGELEALFLPGLGMLGASLRHRGAEILRRVDDLEGAAVHGTTAGIPLLHPWANRLDGAYYQAGGRNVELDVSSPLLHLDRNGLPIHGVPWAMLAWEVTDATSSSIAARLDWVRSELLALFPFCHRLEMAVQLVADALTLNVTLIAGEEGQVPVSFGFHPYVGLPGLTRDEWQLTLPMMRSLVLDKRGIPTGDEVPFESRKVQLAGLEFDDAFALQDERAALAITGAGRRVSVEFLEGYRYAQVYAPKGEDCIALEPMTAPTNALKSGVGLRWARPGERFRAAFRIRIEAVR
jgi:aldose 1-epimerase